MKYRSNLILYILFLSSILITNFLTHLSFHPFAFTLFKQALQVYSKVIRVTRSLQMQRYKSNMYMTFLFQNVICDIYKNIYIYIRFFVIFSVIDFFCFVSYFLFAYSFAYIFFYQEFHIYIFVKFIQTCFSLDPSYVRNHRNNRWNRFRKQRQFY